MISQFSSVQSLSRVRLFATPRIAARQASLSITNSRSSLRLTSIESVMPSSHLILCCSRLLLPPIPPRIRVFSNESTLRMRWPKSFSNWPVIVFWWFYDPPWAPATFSWSVIMRALQAHPSFPISGRGKTSYLLKCRRDAHSSAWHLRGHVCGEGSASKDGMAQFPSSAMCFLLWQRGYYRRIKLERLSRWATCNQWGDQITMGISLCFWAETGWWRGAICVEWACSGILGRRNS